MNILITNDDGIQADGIIELANSTKTIANVYLVAPDIQRSATGACNNYTRSYND